MSNVSRIRFKDRTLVDLIHENPIDKYQARARRRNLVIFLIAAAGIIAVRGWLN